VWSAFRKDPAWQKLKTGSEAHGPMVTRMEYYLLRSLPFAKSRGKHKATRAR